MYFRRMIKRVTYIIGLLLFLCAAYRTQASTPSYTVTHFTEEDGFSQSLVMDIIQDSTGYIWLATWDGLARYDGYRFKTYKARPGDNCPLETNRIDAIREMADGNILCKSGGELYHFIRQTEEFKLAKETKKPLFTSYKANAQIQRQVQSMPEYQGIETRILLVDRQGGIWIMSNRGLERLSPAQKRQSPTMYGTENVEMVRTIYQDRSGRIWMADKNGYVRIIHSQKTNDVKYLSPIGKVTDAAVPFGNNVYTIMEDTKGYIWMGCKPGGIYRLQPQENDKFHMEHFTHQPTDDYSLSNDNVYSITEDKHGHIWIGTYGGGINLVSSDNKGKIRFIHSGNKMRGYPETASFVYCLYAHSQGTLFIGTNNGLYTCEQYVTAQPEELNFYHYRKESEEIHSLSNNWVTDMIPDKMENLYIATYGGGLNYLDMESMKEGRVSFDNYTTENGLASDIIIALAQDHKGNIWCASETALSCYNPQDQTSINYMQGAFATRFSFMESALVCMADSSLMAGTSQGTLTLRTKEMEKSRFVPPIAFDCPETIRLNPEEKTLTISFAALDYNKREPIRYAYRIEDNEHEWNYTTDNHINLSNIPAGISVLHVRSTNGDGVWVENGRTITIHRTPYFNERPIAWMLYGGLLLFAIGFVLKTVHYIRHLRKELNDTKLTTGETIEYLTTKLQESLSKKEEKHPQLPQVEMPDTDDEVFREKVEAFISINLSNSDLDMENFAREIGVSRSNLYLQMKRIYGCTPNNYLNDIRITHAKRMMETGHTNISIVAYNCGYSDPKYFSRCFKKSVGMTPSEYIKSIQ